MYTHIKGVQIIISLLKQYGIKHIVLSPGTRNTALSNSIQDDPFFHCYSIVDERSAAFFALGIAEALNEGACVSCTAATATANYLPAVREAYERGGKLSALTADRDRYKMFHMEDQCIDQVDMYHGYVKKAVSLPLVKNDRDYWYCNRITNEALQSIDHHGTGPVQINFDMSYPVAEIGQAFVKDLPVTRRIERFDGNFAWDELAGTLSAKKRILVLCGSDYVDSDRLRESVRKFAKAYCCAVIYDNFSNTASKGAEYMLHPGPIGDVIGQGEKPALKPDLIISFGNIYYNTVKNFLSDFSKETDHWQIATDGRINDGFCCLKKVFECRPEEFLEQTAERSETGNDGVYYDLWKKQYDRIKWPELPFTHFKVIRTLCSRLPENCLLHTSVLNAIRLSNYSHIPPTVTSFANTGADGIDGALSTFLGQAQHTDAPAVLLVGDLSLLYDANALLTQLPGNARILVINNYAGAEFHRNFGRQIKTVNRFIAAGHKTKVLQCAPMTNAEYLMASDEATLDKALDSFFAQDQKPKILEVFTTASVDGETINRFWDLNKPVPGSKKLKKTIKKILGNRNTYKLKKLIGKR